VTYDKIWWLDSCAEAAPNLAMPKDGLKRLPDHIVPLLLRALMSIASRNDRLALQRAEFGRAPGWHDDKDFNVVWRGRPVGRIHYFDRYDEPERKGP
jgi:hypothetical protein